VGGWGIDGVTIFQSGVSARPLQRGRLTTRRFWAGSRPNVVAGCSKGSPLSGRGQLNEWFNTACFTAPADFTFGNESRTDPTLRGSGVKNFDFALFKGTRFGPDESLESSFGRSSSTSLTGRNLLPQHERDIVEFRGGKQHLPWNKSAADPVRTEVCLLKRNSRKASGWISETSTLRHFSIEFGQRFAILLPAAINPDVLLFVLACLRVFESP